MYKNITIGLDLSVYGKLCFCISIFLTTEDSNICIQGFGETLAEAFKDFDNGYKDLVEDGTIERVLEFSKKFNE